jgi:hypothetical protein
MYGSLESYFREGLALGPAERAALRLLYGGPGVPPVTK